MSKIKDKARRLARRPYVLIVFRDVTTDDEPIYLAMNPELDGCMAQGETMQEAQENLNEFRVDLIEHLLAHELPVPEPAWMATSTENDDNVIAVPVKREEDFKETLVGYLTPDV
jgi:predicted RNase H-like HicB family nuclease